MYEDRKAKDWSGDLVKLCDVMPLSWHTLTSRCPLPNQTPHLPFLAPFQPLRCSRPTVGMVSTSVLAFSLSLLCGGSNHLMSCSVQTASSMVEFHRPSNFLPANHSSFLRKHLSCSTYSHPPQNLKILDHPDSSRRESHEENLSRTVTVHVSYCRLLKG